jgi:hypothetical protein
MNIDERQHPLQAPQGTSAPPFPDCMEAWVTRSHSEKLPAGSSAGGSIFLFGRGKLFESALEIVADPVGEGRNVF